MDEETKRLAEEVGTAINESVQQSPSVAAAIERLREAGFEMELTLKLEIGLRPQSDDNEAEEGSTGPIDFTEEDLRILRSMSNDEVRRFAEEHGWHVVSRLGGRQIEFYNDASARADL